MAGGGGLNEEPWGRLGGWLGRRAFVVMKVRHPTGLASQKVDAMGTHLSFLYLFLFFSRVIRMCQAHAGHAESGAPGGQRRASVLRERRQTRSAKMNDCSLSFPGYVKFPISRPRHL